MMSAVTAQKEGLEVVNWNQLYVDYYFPSQKDQIM